MMYADYADELDSLHNLHEGLQWVLTCPNRSVRLALIRIVTDDMIGQVGSIVYRAEQESVTPSGGDDQNR